MKKVFLLFIILLGVLWFGCRQEAPTKTQTLDNSILENRVVIREQLDTPVNTIDPAYVQNNSEVSVARLLFQGLFKETDLGIKPAIVDSWKVSPDKLTYTFHLKPKVLFHNGKKITAGDFKFSWERVLRLHAPSAYLFTNIKGADQVLSGKQKVASGIKALNDSTLIVTLNKPQPNFVNSLTHPAGAVLDRYEVVEQGVNFAKPGTLTQAALIPSGSGPFSLVEWVDGKYLTLGRYQQYFGAKPQVWRIEFIMNQSTENAVIDFFAGKNSIVQDVTSPKLPKLLKQYGNLPIYEKSVRQFRYVVMNAERAPFRVKAVRDAVCYGLDSSGILKNVRGKSGEVLPGYITNYWFGQPGQEKANFAYDRNSSVRLLEQAGFSGGKGLPELIMYCGPTGEDKQAAQQIVNSLEKVGFRLKVQSLPYKDLRKVIKNGEAAIYTAVFSAKGSELDTFFIEQVDSRWQKSIVNPLWDQLIAKASQQDESEKMKTFRQLENEILSDARIKYLYSYKSAVMVSENIEVFALTPGNNVIFEKISLK
ncbi:MAG: ABC transporter substrate-binding protein [Bacillota bacterium]|jgi:ABC-type transport system substrate-binding protein